MKEINEEELTLLTVLAEHGMPVHYTIAAKMADMSEGKALYWLSKSKRFFKRRDPGVYFIKGKSPGRRYDVSELLEEFNR